MTNGDLSFGEGVPRATRGELLDDGRGLSLSELRARDSVRDGTLSLSPSPSLSTLMRLGNALDRSDSGGDPHSPEIAESSP